MILRCTVSKISKSESLFVEKENTNHWCGFPIRWRETKSSEQFVFQHILDVDKTVGNWRDLFSVQIFGRPMRRSEQAEVRSEKLQSNPLQRNPSLQSILETGKGMKQCNMYKGYWSDKLGIRPGVLWGGNVLAQCFSTFVRPRPGKFFFHTTRAWSQQIYSSVPFQF